MGNYGMKVTRSGYGVSETDPRNYAFWSKLSTVKIFKQGSGTATIPSGSWNVTVQIAHGLSFIPMYLLYSQLKDGSGKWFLNRAGMSSGDADAGDQYVGGGFTFPPYVEVGLFVDATNLNIVYETYNNGVAHDIDYYYFIFGDKGGT